MLTTAQLVTLKADVIANPDTNLLYTDGNLQGLADLYNAEALPAYTVWKTSVPTREVKTAFLWTEYIGRSACERDAFQFMLSNGVINPADANVRQGIADIFSGPSGAQSRTNLLAIGKRSASRLEKLFATGTGTVASPSTMTVEGVIAYTEFIGL